MAEKLEFVQEDWLEYDRRERQRIIEEIAAELHREHPELFDGSLFGGQKLDVEAVICRAMQSHKEVDRAERERERGGGILDAEKG